MWVSDAHPEPAGLERQMYGEAGVRVPFAYAPRDGCFAGGVGIAGVTCHARWWGRYRKFLASAAAKDPVEPFIDPEGYQAYIDAAEAELRSGRLH